MTTAARDGAVEIATADPLPLDRVAAAHELVDAGSRSRILVAIPD
jgi:NADPH2:quinone reductase